MSEPPSWGVLVRAPLHQVAAFLRAARPSYEVEALSFRHNAEWTAAFYMEPAPGGETDAAQELRGAGFHAIHLNFDLDRYHVHRWRGGGWARTGECPVIVCAEAGIEVPGHAMPTLPAPPFRPTRVRAIAVVENMSADAVARVRGEQDLPDLIEEGPRGALVTMHPWCSDEPTFDDLSERVPNRVFHLELDPVDGRFVCLILLDGVVQSIFEVGDTWVTKNAPLVDNVEGATTPHGIVERLGVPLAFLRPPDPNE